MKNVLIAMTEVLRAKLRFLLLSVNNIKPPKSILTCRHLEHLQISNVRLSADIMKFHII